MAQHNSDLMLSMGELALIAITAAAILLPGATHLCLHVRRQLLLT